MRRSNEIAPIYSLGFVCEGEKTEPYFVTQLHNKVKDAHQYTVTMNVHPTPTIANETTGKPSGRRKDVLTATNVKIPDPLVKKYQHLPMPENWVMAGEELLSTCNEVWVLFDKDGHPNMQQAFASVAKLRAQNKCFNVVFSSRCFEHYMLLHYELNYTAFNKSECNRKVNGRTEYADCQLPEANDWGCDGTQCINGYARSHGYWQKSKDEKAFDKCRNLWWGILNAFHVKWHSLCTEPVTMAIYDRNPYLNIYQMTLRMMEMVSLEPFAQVKIDKGSMQYNILSRDGNTLRFECQSLFPIKRVDIKVYNLPTDCELANASNELRQLLESAPVVNSITLDLILGQYAEIDLNTILQTPQQYAKLEWNGVVYFVAPLLWELPEMTPSQVDALRVISVTEDMIKAI